MLQRPLNSTFNVARDGAAKKLVVPATLPGQKRQTTGDVGASYHHGITVDDRPNTTKTYTGSTPVHPGMVTSPVADDKFRGKHDPQLGGVVLSEGSNLGRKA